MGFQNPISGAQGALERQQIKSPNYVSGSAGWAIKRDGSAEFNNITIRGASSVGGEALWYNGTPALGNMIFSISAADYTDPYGNHVPQGATAYTQSFSTDVQLINGSLTFGKASADFANGAYLYQGLTAGGDLSLNTGAGDSSHSNALRASYRSGQSSQPTGSTTTPALSFLSGDLTSPVDVHLPGSVIATSLNGTAETWQTASYAAHWSAGTTIAGLGGTGLRFRRMAEDDLWIYGLAAAGAGALNTVATLPADYRTAAGAVFPTPHGSANLERAGALSTVEVAIDGSGNIIVSGTPANGDVYSFNFRVPLGHLA